MSTTSSLHAAEVDRLPNVIRGLRDSGIGIVYVSHFLEELLDISDSLVILLNGKRVPEHIAPVAERLNDEIAAMLGEFLNRSPSDRKSSVTKLVPWASLLRSNRVRSASSG